MRERITISIRKDLLSKVDQQIDGARLRNRSHAIEHYISESLGVADVSNAVILGGGKGALKLIPIIENTIKDLQEYGINLIYLAVGYLGPKIKEYLGDGTKYGVKIVYVEGGEGTAGALNPLKQIFKKTFIVANLDEQMNVDLKKLVSFHRKHLSTATIAIKDFRNPKGIYVFEPDIFKYIPSSFSMLETNIFPELIKENKLIASATLEHETGSKQHRLDQLDKSV